MQLITSRFGTLAVDDDSLFLFPQGVVGMETLRQWVLLPDPASPAVAWLQSASRGDRAIAVVSPRAFLPDYRVSVTRRDLAPLRLRTGDQVYVLCTLAGHVGRLEANLRAPILLNLNRKLGQQVVTTDQTPLRFPLRLDGPLRAAA